MADLKINYKDDILDLSENPNRRFKLIPVVGEDDVFELQDVTEYAQHGDQFGATDINATNAKVNANSDALTAISTNLAQLSQRVIHIGDPILVSVPVTQGQWNYKTFAVPTLEGYAFLNFCLLMLSNSQGIGASHEHSSNTDAIWVYGRTTGTASIVVRPIYVPI